MPIIDTPSFNPNRPIPNEPFENDSEEFLIQTGDKMMASGALQLSERGAIVVNAEDIEGILDCGLID